jgi:hypothetical protein
MLVQTLCELDSDTFALVQKLSDKQLIVTIFNRVTGIEFLPVSVEKFSIEKGEFHIPVSHKTDNGVTVSLGSYILEISKDGLSLELKKVGAEL